ncbi:MAG: hypothetical protein PW792_12355 [Acidobacteriaceae bacterium]|nr:hypothetical protein [Acidobacteriaceae bacterium]
MPFTDINSLYAAIRDTAEKLAAAGLVSEGKNLRNAMLGSTGGEVLGALGSQLKRIAVQENLPQELREEIETEIAAIDSSYDRISQPRPRFEDALKVN